MRLNLKARNYLHSALFLVLCLIFPVAIADPVKNHSVNNAILKIPELNQHVTDLTGTISPSQINSINIKLQEFEDKTGSQIAILIIQSTYPEEISQYSIRVVDEWKLGRKGVDDGVLLLIAKKDRHIRVEVGYGLEGVLSDAKSKQIISELILPYFKSGQYFEGINAGLDEILALIARENISVQAKTNSQQSEFDPFGLLIFVFVAALALGGFVKKLIGVGLAGLLIGIVSGFTVWIFTQLLSVSLFAALIAILATFFGNAGSGPLVNGSYIPTIRGRGIDDRFNGGGGGFGGGGASGEW